MEDFLAPLIIAAPGALISILCLVLAAVFMERARTPALLVMLAGLLTALQAIFTVITHLFLLPMMIDGALSEDLYSILVNGAYHLLYLGITASLLIAAFIGRSRPQNPAATPLSEMPASVQKTSPPASPAHSAQRPHRGSLVLTLGLLGMLVFAPLGIAAWIMASGDLRAMGSGQMDSSGEGITLAGKILGILATVLAIIGICVATVLLVAFVTYG